MSQSTPLSRSIPAEQRFWLRVRKTPECWEWLGTLDRDGYGRMKVNGVKTRVHRYSYELHNEPIPDGMVVDHICHNTSCVRPEHLRVATVKQNNENFSGPWSNNTSGVRGVEWNVARNCWRGRVMHNGKRISKLSKDKAEVERWVIARRVELHTHNELDRIAG